MALNPYSVPAPEYAHVRPQYPSAALDIVKGCLCRGGSSGLYVLDVGAGTGIMTGQLVKEFGEQCVVAVEPSAAMLHQLRFAFPNIRLVSTDLEGVLNAAPDLANSVGVAVCAQSFHWLDMQAAASVFSALIPLGGAVVVINNQLNIELPWVHRLTRIMRSGDVHRINKPPCLGSGFADAELSVSYWSQALTVDEVMALARTRSSYLRSNAVNRARMQANLRWYLEHFLGLHGNQQLSLPYVTHTWVLHRAR